MSEHSRTNGHWPRAALAASTLLNLFLLAVVGGYWWHSRTNSAAPSLPLDRVLARIEANLSPKEAAAFSDVMRRKAPQYLQAALKLRATRQALSRQLEAQQLDPQASHRALVEWQRAWNQFLNDFSDPLVEGLAQVSPEGRRRLLGESSLDTEARHDSLHKLP